MKGWAKVHAMEERDNVGSAARDQLANERTFLAWVRTGLGLIGVGVVLAKLVEVGTTTQIGGLAFVLWGTLLLGYAFVRYRAVTSMLERGKFRAAAFGPIFVTVAGFIAAIVAAVLVWH